MCLVTKKVAPVSIYKYNGLVYDGFLYKFCSEYLFQWRTEPALKTFGVSVEPNVVHVSFHVCIVMWD